LPIKRSSISDLMLGLCLLGLYGCESVTLPPISNSDSTVMPTMQSPVPTIEKSQKEVSSQIEFFDEVLPVKLEVEPLTYKGVSGSRYRLATPGTLLGVFSENEVLVRSENNSISVINLTDSTSRKLVDSVRYPVEIVLDEERLIVPLRSETSDYPIFSIGFYGEYPQLLGKTTGYFPFYSVTNSGRVLVIEDGYLTLKWYEDDKLMSQSLTQIERTLGLSWSEYDFTKSPDDSDWKTPWIDFEISPNGEYIALYDDNHAKFWIVTLDGSVIREFERQEYDSVEDTGPEVEFLGWSPDSRHLIYRQGAWKSWGPALLYLKLVSVNGDESPSELTFIEQSTAQDATWSINGQYIAYAENRWDSMGPDGSVRGSHISVLDVENMDRWDVSDLYYPGGLYWDESFDLYFNCWGDDLMEVHICRIQTQY